MRKALGTAAFVLVLLVNSSAPAFAAWPGNNGPIAFSSSRDGQRNIYITPGAAQPDTRLTNVSPDDTSPSISPDGTKIVFSSRRTDVAMGGVNQIWVMDTAGGGQQDVSDDAIDSNFPSWSPDGSKVLYTRPQTQSAVTRTQLWVMNADGTNKHAVFPAFTGFADSQAVWSATGDKLAFVSTRDGLPQIYVVGVNAATALATGSGTRISDLSSDDSKPDWSPSSISGFYWIAFASGTSGDREIWKMREDGTGRFQITNNTADNFEPAYSPDGNNIVFTSHPASTTVVYTVSVNVTGGALVNVTDPNGTEGSNDQPTWGPLAEQGPVVPEVSMALLLPLSMIGIIGAALGVNTRRRRPSPR